MRPDLPPLLAAAALVNWGALACVPIGAEAPAREAVVGLPCEGCEAVFDGLPAALSWAARLAPDGEPGEALVLEGTVRDPAGRPAAGIIIYAYQTDAHGVYPRDRSAPSAAARRHGRLRGWAQTDERGRYRFDTIRPAGYPDSPVAQHIHMHVIEPGCCTYYIDDVHFEDDARLGEAERRRLLVGRGGSGLVRPVRDENGVWRARRDIRLGESVPGYPGERARQAPPGS
jgi:protocatechuate 3,4-dioxygenase beta subunit